MVKLLTPANIFVNNLTAQPTASLPPKPARPRRSFGLWKIIIVLAILGSVISAGAIFVPGPLPATKDIVIAHGLGTRDIAETLESDNAIYSSFLFRVAAKLLVSNVLKAGEYNIPGGASIADIVVILHEGHSIVRLFTVAEGLTSAEVAQTLNNDMTFGNDHIATPAEGSLMPESYRYIFGDSRGAVIGRMQKAMQDMLADLWAKRDPSVLLTSPQQALVMASVIEKETGKASERPRIAGVFYNRLRDHMRLQSDPTVIYGIALAKGVMDHDIAHADLAFPSPYNTYMNDGLPPGPICNPGKAAIEAALHPEANEYLYFVADGTGGHAFAKTLDEHNKNVTRWNEMKAK
jgi:UPF0755 protein